MRLALPCRRELLEFGHIRDGSVDAVARRRVRSVWARSLGIGAIGGTPDLAKPKEETMLGCEAVDLLLRIAGLAVH